LILSLLAAYCFALYSATCFALAIPSVACGATLAEL
jgi:hypothetical protein